MATQTKNYKFKKPDRKEFFNVADLNDNLDAIDGVLGGKQEAEVKDTNNILGAGPGKKALIQTLFDSIGDWFINKLVTNDNFVAKFSERLVNNGTANLEGFALDARQGNPTVPGSMAKQISELNSQANYHASYIRDFNSAGGPYFGFSNNWNPAIYISPKENKLFVRYKDENEKNQMVVYKLTRY